MPERVNIDVVDSSTKDNGFLADNRQYNPKAIASSGVASMVNGITAKLSGNKIARLRIFGHGAPGSQGVGGGQCSKPDQSITVNLFGKLSNRVVLALLTSHFHSEAVVQLHGCSVGKGWKGRTLIKRLADLWHVRIQAALAMQFADTANAYEGVHYIEADGTAIYGGSCLFGAPIGGPKTDKHRT